MTRLPRTVRPAAALATAGLLLSACSGDRGGEPSAQGSSPAASATTSSPATDPAASGTSTGPGSSAGAETPGGSASPAEGASGSGEPSASGSSPDSSTSTGAPAGKGESFTVLSTGDVLAHAAVIRSAKGFGTGDAYDFTPQLEPVAPFLQAGDLTLCNQETPLTPTNEDVTAQQNIMVFNTPHEQAEALAEAGFDACSTSNNHTLDQGVEGVERTREVMEEAGVLPIGPAESATAGRTEDGGDNPTILEADGHKVGVLTYSYNVANMGLAQSLPSHPWMEQHMWFAQGPEGIAEQAAEAREQGAEVVVAVVHWGTEYVAMPTAEQDQLAQQLLGEDSGVDAIFGHHAHVPQPCQTIEGRTVFYGLGNFLSAQRKKPTNTFPPNVQDGAIAGITFTADGKGGWEQQASVQPTWVTQPDHVIEPATPDQHAESHARTMDVMNRLGDSSCQPTELTPQG
ncbi:poly-gamma-glutamate synthesis protein (capsule biosynthesis protein) [Kytococcus aerolatus]|uniref:Poly-gamma-glutamate synthesis protein (Capsule biosynthesis protein) n=1 Tax=Kytococcus aerolatus TaxID=592308 RepID=A0A212U2E7_9MICO|nr:CapA family protein [Kytococcus aerolatus]SNC72296.1 poly-gamma-glutamate synthesis protein (capsule biosynthesis protein) [Kytococcus aerolatus]